MAGEVWAVVFGNYIPDEVIELYDNEDAAKAHAADEVDDCRVVAWQVRSTYESGASNE